MRCKTLSAGALMLLALLLPSAVATAQSSRTAVGVGESFTAAMTPPAQGEPTGLRLYLDGVKVGQDIAIPASGEATATVPGISAPGAHTLSASAFNAAGESTKVTLSIWVGPPPAPGLRIQVVTTQVFEPEITDTGGLQLRLVDTRTAITEVK